jgi:hypothetical protein
MAGETADVVALTALVTAEFVWTAIESSVPESNTGHKKLTRVAETLSTGTYCPLTATFVPAKSSALPEGSDSSDKGAANHLPVTAAIEPGLHEGAKRSRTGTPASTSIDTCSLDNWPAEFTAENVIVYLPAWDAFGVQSKRPFAASKEAPAGMLATAI